MVRKSVAFRQADLTRAVKAVRAAGLEVAKTVIDPDGTISLLHHADPEGATNAPFDKWKAVRNAR